MIRMVLFDFYGVFIPDSYGEWLKKNSLKREGIFARLIDERDRGVVSEPFFLSELSRLLERGVLSSEIHVKEVLIDSELINLIRELKLQYKIGLFSNASEKLHVKLENLNLTNLFDTIIISSEIGFSKPSKEAFQAAVKICGVQPNEIFFIDDNSINVSAASDCGLTAAQFTAVDDLRQALISHQIL